MTLPEFLDARIADDEADVTRRRQWYARSVKFDGEDYTERFDTVESIDRAARECEAKRRIVECAPARPLDATDAAWIYACQLLATVYADHPDYQQEWSP